MKRRRYHRHQRLAFAWLLIVMHGSSSVGGFMTHHGGQQQRAHRQRYRPSPTPLSAASTSDDAAGGTLCIKFSRCYQRFIAYRPRRGRERPRSGRRSSNVDAILNNNNNNNSNNASSTTTTSQQHLPNRRLFCRFDDECREVVQSFLYLDEAMEEYPTARLVKLPEVSDRDDDADFNQVVPGMGIRPSSSISRIVLDPDNRDVGLVVDDEDDVRGSDGDGDLLQTQPPSIHQNITRDGLDALEYLSSLTASLVASQTKAGADGMDELRQNIASTLRERIGLKRFMEHSPQSLQHNFNRLMDLFTRSRTRNDNKSGGSDEIMGPGLALEESEARSMISYFPEVCLYDTNEVEERIHFFLSPLPPEDMVGSLSDVPTSKRKRRGPRPANSTSATPKKEIDWARLSWEGYGAGMTVEQATKAVRAVPNLLSLRHTDSRKPNMLYYMQELKVSAQMSILTERNLEKYIMGTEASDAWAFAYLHTIGLQWSQLRIILDAFPTLTCVSTEANWELRQKKETSKAMDEFSLIFLRKRLQISPRDLFLMVKTHPQLSWYKVEQMLPKLDAFQEKLGLTCRDLRKIMLRQPSLLGLSEDNVRSKLDFLRNEVGMTIEEVRQALLKQPSMLQYSIDTLRSKLDFLRNELCMSPMVACRVLRAAPTIFGLSLDENIRPKVATLMIRCRLLAEEVGLIAASVPSILVLSSKRKIEPCLSYLSVALRLPDEASLGAMIKAAPRILLQSINSALEPKLQMMTEALEEEQLRGTEASAQRASNPKVSELFVKNPALLATTNAILSKRIKACMESPDNTLAEAMGPSTKGRRPKFTIVNGKVKSVEEGFDVDGEIEGEGGYMSEALAEAVSSLMSSGPSFGDLASMSTSGSTPLAITLFISGQVFPPNSPDEPRADRVGGMAIQIAQKLSVQHLKSAAESSTSAVIPETDEPGSNYETGLILLKFPHLRASRHRCELCSCEIALKIILLYLRGSASSCDLSQYDVRIEVCTDSNYVMKMVKDKSLLRRLGDCSNLNDTFDYDGPGPRSHANLDILYPLSQYYADLITGRPRPITIAATTESRSSGGSNSNNENSDDVCIGGSVSVSFKHLADVCSGKLAEQTTYQMFKYARQAAMWSYDRERKLRLGVK